MLIAKRFWAELTRRCVGFLPDRAPLPTTISSEQLAQAHAHTLMALRHAMEAHLDHPAQDQHRRRRLPG